MGYGEISYLPLWKGISTPNRSEAFYFYQVNIIKALMEEEDVCELKHETASDPELQAVAKAISNR